MSDGPAEAANVVTAAIGAVSAALGAALGAFGLWLANRMMGKAAFQTAINQGFQALTDQLQEERTALNRMIMDERIAWEAERAQLRGEIINLTQTVESLKHLLERHGIPIPGLAPKPAPKAVRIDGEAP